MTPAELSKIARGLSAELGFKDRFIMTYRPRICPFHILIDYVPLQSRILDVGCGSGLWLFLLSRLGRIVSATGIDVCDHGIEIANSIGKYSDNLSFLKLGLEDDWPQGDFNCLSMIDVMHHVQPSGREGFMERIKRVNSKRIIFKDIDPGAWFKSKMNTLHDMVLSRQIPRYALPDEIVNKMTSIGYSLIEKRRCDMLWYSHFLLVFERN